jgi:fibro-slime domain-containing protein
MPDTDFDGNPLFFPADEWPICDETSGELLNCRLMDTMRNGEVPGPDITGQSTYETNWTLQEPPAEHNHSFTTEVSYWFEYDAANPPVLNFLGDDDLWVFINGKLALDLGGVHYPAEGTISLDATTVETHALGLIDGTVYPIHIFHAERNPRGSSFRLTLSGFRAERSLCIPNCGDGIVAGSEECDDGDNDGGHNECQPGCVLSTYCGDGVVNGDEACDDADPNAPGDCSGCRIITVR